MKTAANADLAQPPAAHTAAARTHARSHGSSLSLWLWVATGFLFLAVLWSIMFTAARSANVQSVPLVTKGAKP